MYTAIAKNKRNTVFIMALFVGIIGAIGWIISYFYGNNDIAIWVFVVALLYAGLQYFIADKLTVAMTGAEQISKSDNPRFYRVVENLAITTGLPTPKVYIIDDTAPNAFATGRDPNHAIVAATSGLIDLMSDSELEAVMAHEMGHVKNYDIRISMITFGLVSAISFLSDIVLRTMMRGRGRDSDNMSPVVLVIGVIALILAPIVAVIIQMAISRQREFLADVSSAMTTRNPEALASALEKLRTYGRPMQRQNTASAHIFFTNPLKTGFFSKLFSTHPPLEERINRLNQIGDKF